MDKKVEGLTARRQRVLTIRSSDQSADQKISKFLSDNSNIILAEILPRNEFTFVRSFSGALISAETHCGYFANVSIVTRDGHEELKNLVNPDADIIKRHLIKVIKDAQKTADACFNLAVKGSELIMPENEIESCFLATGIDKLLIQIA